LGILGHRSWNASVITALGVGPGAQVAAALTPLATGKWISRRVEAAHAPRPDTDVLAARRLLQAGKSLPEAILTFVGQVRGLARTLVMNRIQITEDARAAFAVGPGARVPAARAVTITLEVDSTIVLAAHCLMVDACRTAALL